MAAHDEAINCGSSILNVHPPLWVT